MRSGRCTGIHSESRTAPPASRRPCEPRVLPHHEHVKRARCCITPGEPCFRRPVTTCTGAVARTKLQRHGSPSSHSLTFGITGWFMAQPSTDALTMRVDAEATLHISGLMSGSCSGAASTTTSSQPSKQRSAPPDPFPQAVADFVAHYPQVPADSKPRLSEMVGVLQAPPPLLSGAQG